MAIKKSQLYSTLWESCNALRGSMDASQYKDYVLMILFVKYLSDKARQGQTALDVPDGCDFKDFVDLKQNPHIGEKINEKLEAIREANTAFIGDLTLPNFNDDNKLGSGKTKVETLSKLIGEFQRDELDFSLNRAADDDLLGDAYEYLMKNFAAESGKSKGQFYTPAEVSRVMAKMLHMEDFNRASHTIYDMTCGSGSLLLRALNETPNETPNDKPTLYGQEKDSSTASLAKLNMLLHGIESADIKVGDTLGEPKFTTGTLLDTFDVCVANPPFSQKNWMPSNGESDLYHRWNPNLLPPAKCGDFAFLLHFISSMKPDTGRGACILPHGVLFRGNAEYTIRRHIVELHYLKGIIGLPPNLFYGTGIPACILILDKRDTAHREGIFFIDAKDGFRKDGNKNRLREQDIKRIVDVWNEQQSVPHYARMVTWEEIEQNDFNLNIPRYVQPRDTEVQHDIDAHLHGGIPAHDVKALENYWQVCPSLKSDLFTPRPDGRYDLATDKQQIAQAIAGNDSFASQKQLFTQSMDQWRRVVEPEMKAIDRGCRPKQLISHWSESLLQTAKADRSLADAYSIYDRLMNYWAETMQDDCYMVSNDGWTLPSDLAPEKKSGIYSDIVCDLLPVDIILDSFFSCETSEIELLKKQIELLETNIANLQEEHSEDFDGYEKYSEIKNAYIAATYKQPMQREKEILLKLLDMPSNNKSAKNARNEFIERHRNVFEGWEKFGKTEIKRRIKEIEIYHPLLSETMEFFKEYIEMSEKVTAIKAEIKRKSAVLTKSVIEKYSSLSKSEIKELVVNHKWLDNIVAYCEDLMQTISHKISEDVLALADRYEHTLPSLEADTCRYEEEVNGYLKEMGFIL